MVTLPTRSRCIQYTVSSNGGGIESLGLSTSFVGIFSGWRMDGDGVEGRVDPGEELRRFENKGQEPQSPKKGSKKFSKYRILKM